MIQICTVVHICIKSNQLSNCDILFSAFEITYLEVRYVEKGRLEKGDLEKRRLKMGD